MNIWILKDGEPIAALEEYSRVMRAGLLANYLSEQGHNVTFWTSTWSHYQKRKYASCDTSFFDKKHNIKIKMLDSTGYRNNISLRRLWHYTKLALKFYRSAKKLSPPDLIISALPSVELSFAAIIYAKKYKSKILIDLRDMWPDIFVEVCPKPFRWLVKFFCLYQFWMMKYLCRKADGLIAITEPYLNWALTYASRGIRDSDITLPLVYPNSVPAKANYNHCPISLRVYDEKNITFDNKFTVVFAGSFSKRAFNLEFIINAFDKLPNSYQLLIAGKSIDNKYIQKKYENLASRTDNVKLLGWLDFQQLKYLYKNSHIAVAPYLNKKYFQMNLTNKPIEYLAYGLPILTSVRGYLSSLLLEHECGYLYNDNDENNFINLIKSLYRDQKLYNKMKNNTLNLFENKFDYINVMRSFSNYLDTYILRNNSCSLN